MRFAPTVPFWILVASAGLSAVISHLMWRRRLMPGGRVLAFLMAAVAGWMLIAALEAGSVLGSSKILWSRFEYVGSGTTALLFMIFAFRYSGRGLSWLRPRRIPVLLLGPVFNVAVAMTNSLHHLLWTDVSPGREGSNLLVYHHGPLFYAVLGVIAAYVLPATAVLIHTALGPGVVHRRQAGTVLLAAAAPWIGTLLYVLELAPLEGLNLIPMSFALSGLILSTSIVGLRHFDVLPVARDALVESMGDGVLVMDPADRVIDINPAACAFLGVDKRAVGRPAGAVLAAWPQIAAFCMTRELRHKELVLRGEPLSVVDIRAAPLTLGNGASRGRLIVVRDITALFRAERAARDANDQLRRKIDEIEALQEELREQAIRDSLTGLFNRRYLEETVPRELAVAKRKAGALSLVLLDLDGFKQLNDSQGHHAGDEALRTIGEALLGHTRAGDIACRYGGDEFIVVAPDAPLEAAVRRAEELRSQLIESGRVPDSVSVSFGIASYPDHGLTTDALLRAADRALYRAKAAGKNRVRTAES